MTNEEETENSKEQPMWRTSREAVRSCRVFAMSRAQHPPVAIGDWALVAKWLGHALDLMAKETDEARVAKDEVDAIREEALSKFDDLNELVEEQQQRLEEMMSGVREYRLSAKRLRRYLDEGE